MPPNLHIMTRFGLILSLFVFTLSCKEDSSTEKERNQEKEAEIEVKQEVTYPSDPKFDAIAGFFGR